MSPSPPPRGSCRARWCRLRARIIFTSRERMRTSRRAWTASASWTSSGSRPMNKAEAERMYKIEGQLFMVENKRPGAPNRVKGRASPELQQQIADKKQELEDAKTQAKKDKAKKELDELLKQAADAEKEL